MATLKQYGVLVVGLLMAGGFAFGGMASYSQMINTGGGNNNQDDIQDVELPANNFQEGPYNLSIRERVILSVRDDVAIVSAVYNSSEGREKMMGLRNLSDKLSGRAFVSVVNASESEVADRYQITKFPKVLLFGFKTSNRRSPVPATVDGEITERNVGNTICNVMRDWGNAATYCSTN